MTNRRIVLGATGAGESLSTLARKLRDSGHEVVFVGGQQSAQQLVRTALAEDAAELIVDGDDGELVRIDDLRRELGAGDIVLSSAAAWLSNPTGQRQSAGVTNPTPLNGP